MEGQKEEPAEPKVTSIGGGVYTWRELVGIEIVVKRKDPTMTIAAWRTMAVRVDGLTLNRRAVVLSKVNRSAAAVIRENIYVTVDDFADQYEFIDLVV